jgi:hypothetical protein
MQFIATGREENLKHLRKFLKRNNIIFLPWRNGHELRVRIQIMNINFLCDGHPRQGLSSGTAGQEGREGDTVIPADRTGVFHPILCLKKTDVFENRDILFLRKNDYFPEFLSCITTIFLGFCHQNPVFTGLLPGPPG